MEDFFFYTTTMLIICKNWNSHYLAIGIATEQPLFGHCRLWYVSLDVHAHALRRARHVMHPLRDGRPRPIFFPQASKPHAVQKPGPEMFLSSMLSLFTCLSVACPFHRFCFAPGDKRSSTFVCRARARVSQTSVALRLVSV